jgi:hypothetical protein
MRSRTRRRLRDRIGYGRVVRGGKSNRVGTRRAFRSVLLGLAVSAALTPIGSARAVEPLPVPPGFRLPATNGYALSVFAGQNPKTGRGFVLLRLHSPHAQVVYGASASVTQTSIEADLGSIGKIDVNFVPSGQARTEHSPCADESLSVDSGSYVGRIDFEGEEDYSKAHAISVPGSSDLLLRLVCVESGSEGSGGHSPGARLTVNRSGTPRLEFGAMKNSPTRPARFAASIGERRGPLQISRDVEVTAAPGTFDFDVPEGFAHVRPPAPFSGEATYLHWPGKRTSWRGNLEVDFPGRSSVSLTGAGFRAGMHRAVVNPGHPFRVR